MKRSLYRQLKNVIGLLPEGTVVSVADFTDMAKPKTVSKMLTRLEKEGEVERVMRSIFWKSDGSQPRPNDVAEALARENGWETAPTNETALLLFGMEECAPIVWTYLTNGTNRTYSYGRHTITFTHTAGKAFGKMAKKTRMLVQCIRAYGKGCLNGDVSDRLAEKIRGWDLASLKEETKYAAAWVRTTVSALCKKAAKSV
ncbi:MAG: hypothetical protein IK088_00200 [Lachnospiraceae bacterium]|nr:hypothetical protein [Lachnospiraceae bacterium]